MKKILFFAAMLGFAVACGGQKSGEAAEQPAAEVEAAVEAVEPTVEPAAEAAPAPAVKAEAVVEAAPEAEVEKKEPIASEAKVGTGLSTGEEKKAQFEVKGNIDPEAQPKKAPVAKQPLAKKPASKEQAPKVKSEAKVATGLEVK